MSTRRKFEKVAQLIAICKSPMLGDIINNLAKEVEDEFYHVLNGDEIMVSWSVHDVESVIENSMYADDNELTSDEVREILYTVEHDHDAEHGINWTVIESAVDNYIGKKKG